MEGHWWGEGDTEWKDIGGVRGNRMERHWWGEGGHRMEGHWWDEGTQNGRTLMG